MARKRTKKPKVAGKKRGWNAIVGPLLTFLLGVVVLLLAVSTLIRWISPRREDAIYGRNIIRVEVLNGCGESGVAERVTEWLREQGFDIVYYGNADSFGYERSILFDRSGRPEFAREVGQVLACPNIERRYDGLLLLDVTVIVGKDWRSLRLTPAERSLWESAAYRARALLESWL